MKDWTKEKKGRYNVEIYLRETESLRKPKGLTAVTLSVSVVERNLTLTILISLFILVVGRGRDKRFNVWKDERNKLRQKVKNKRYGIILSYEYSNRITIIIKKHFQYDSLIKSNTLFCLILESKFRIFCNFFLIG